jgi:hypothetical protein
MNKRILLSSFAVLNYFVLLSVNFVLAYRGFSLTDNFDSEILTPKQQIIFHGQNKKNNFAEESIFKKMNEVEDLDDEQAEEDEASERRKYEKEIIKNSASE